jgi:hypothetical protein
MTIRKLVLATAILTAATGFAFAQSAPAPVNQSGGGTTPSQASPTDMGEAGQTGLTKGTPTRGANNGAMMAPTTNGSGVKSPARESAHKAVSPASPDAGIKQEK